ncbi:serine/threonine-protein kinase [Chelativorans salis]|uniref:Protein kinase n=1 Tax=Chelativorans salis TaxID=2978478 RepID=A0ABT2LJE2_9HYPH|nr:serine/threonine-protein kinase [Chelativorans sp. EGI FJ00035]MCT7374159.1 protein kinase [Chelativorans sp. EGI FJ00035]
MNSDDRTRVLPGMTSATVGTQLSGIYELDERIASGGMGEVYRGHNIQTGDDVAIKIVLPEFARDQTMLSLFRKEASILNHLSHDAVVRYHVFTVDPGIGRPYLAMEFVRGQSLFDVMRRGALPAEQVRRLCHRLASGLAAVHEAGAVHRDLSPDNIILPEGRVERAKIIDFGIARSATVGGETLIGGKFAGKYNYVSPEQLGLYGGEVTERSDIYSLGLVLVAALIGEPLDMGGSQLEVVEKRRIVPDLSCIAGELRTIIEAMLQPDPGDRPASMAEIAWMTRDDTVTGAPGNPAPPFAAVDPGREPSPAGSEESGFVPHISPRLPRPPAAPAHAPPPPATTGQSSGRRDIALAAVAAVIIISGAGAYLALRQQAPAPQVESSFEAAPEVAELAVATDQPPPPSPTAQTEAQDSPASPVEEAGIAPLESPAPAAPDTALVEPETAKPRNDSGTATAMNIPKIAVPPPEAIDDAAERISWLRDYQGGACFYATATTVTDKTVEIEGFGTTVEPFKALLEAFQAEFDIEPDISVRLIEPAQCAVTDFLHALGGTKAEKPEFVLDRTSVPSGLPISGRLETRTGLQSSLLLIDNEGMVYNLDKRLSPGAGEATFSIPISLDGEGRAAGAGVPQIMLVITGAGTVQAAAFSEPSPAGTTLPAILAEIRDKGMNMSATAKYFRLGG